MSEARQTEYSGDEFAKRVGRVIERSLVKRATGWIYGFDFFISYRWSDGRSYAVALAEALKDKGYDCFLDTAEFRPGESWSRDAFRALRDTTRLILIASPNAMHDPNGRPNADDPIVRELKLFSRHARRKIRIEPPDFRSEVWSTSPLATFFHEHSLAIRERDTLPSEATLEELERMSRLDRRDRRRTRRLKIFLISLSALSVIAVAFAIVSERQRKRAVAAESEANQQLTLANEAKAETAEQLELTQQAKKDALDKLDLARHREGLALLERAGRYISAGRSMSALVLEQLAYGELPEMPRLLAPDYTRAPIDKLLLDRRLLIESTWMSPTTSNGSGRIVWPTQDTAVVVNGGRVRVWQEGHLRSEGLFPEGLRREYAQSERLVFATGAIAVDHDQIAVGVATRFLPTDTGEIHLAHYSLAANKLEVNRLTTASGRFHPELLLTPDGKTVITIDGRSLVTCVGAKSHDFGVIREGRKRSSGGLELALSADGRILAACEVQRSLTGDKPPSTGCRVWDFETHQQLAHLTVDGILDTLGVTDKGLLVLSTGTALTVWDTATDKQHFSIPVEKGEHPFDILEDGNSVIWVGNDKTLLKTSLIDKTSNTIVQSERTLVAVAVADDRRHIATSSKDGFLEVWDATESRQVFSHILEPGFGNFHPAWEPRSAAVWTSSKGLTRRWPLDSAPTRPVPFGTLGPVTWLKDGRAAAASSDGVIWVWDIDGSREPQHLEGHDASINLLYAPTAGRLVSVGSDGRIASWDLNTGKAHWYKLRWKYVDRLDIDKSGTVALAAQSYGDVQLLNLVDGSMKTLPGRQPAALDPSGTRFVSWHSKTELAIHDLTTGDVRQLPKRPQDADWVMFESHDGLMVKTAGELHRFSGQGWSTYDYDENPEDLQWVHDGRTMVWVGESELLAFNVDAKLLSKAPLSEIGPIAVTTAGEDAVIAAGLQTGAIELWALDRNLDWRWNATAEGHGNRVDSLHFSGTRLLSGSSDGHVRVWDVAGAIPQRIRLDRGINDLAPLAGTVAVAVGNAVALVDVERGATLWQQTVSDDFQAMSVARDKDMIYAGTPGAVVLLRAQDGKLIERLEHDSFLAPALVRTKDGRHIFVASGEPKLLHWELIEDTWQGRPELEFESSGIGFATTIAVTNDGKSLFAATSDSNLWRWRVNALDAGPEKIGSAVFVDAGPTGVVSTEIGGALTLRSPDGERTVWQSVYGQSSELVSIGGERVVSMRERMNVWSTDNPNRFATLPVDEEDIVATLDESGTHVYVGKKNGIIECWLVPNPGPVDVSSLAFERLDLELFFRAKLADTLPQATK